MTALRLLRFRVGIFFLPALSVFAALSTLASISFFRSRFLIYWVLSAAQLKF